VWKAEDGVLVMVPGEVVRAVETEGQKKRSGDEKALLLKPLPVDAFNGDAHGAAEFFHFCALQTKGTLWWTGWSWSGPG
jgi:hypothetical protein